MLPGVAAGLGKYVSPLAGDLFAIALLDASIIGASAVGLATAYASSDVLGFNHSLHRPVTKAKGFYACYAGLMAVSAALVIVPGVPLGLSDRGSADPGRGAASRARWSSCCCSATTRPCSVPGSTAASSTSWPQPSSGCWSCLSVILTASVLFPDITGGQIEAVLGVGCGLGTAGRCVPAGPGEADRPAESSPFRSSGRIAGRGGCRP